MIPELGGIRFPCPISFGLSETPMSKDETLDDLRGRIAELEDAVDRSRQNAGALEGELRKFRLLYDLATAMTGERTLDENLQLIVDRCRDFLHSDLAYIAIFDESRDELYKHSTSGIRSEIFRHSRLPRGKGLGGLVTRARKGHIVADCGAEACIEGPIEQSASEEGLVSGMAVPIQMHDRDIGVIYVFTRAPRHFTTSDLDTLTLIGNLAAIEISRREVEERLRESDERFRFMAETTGDVIYRLRYDSMHYDYLSPGIHKLTGYNQDEIHRIGFANLVSRIDFPSEENVVPDSIIENRREGRTGEYRADYLIQTRTGDARWLRDHSFPWLDASGMTVGSVGILSDVSEYKRAEALVRERTADLIESEEKYRTLVENVPLVVYRMRPNGELLFVNQFVEEVFGYSPLDILSNSALWTDVVYQEDRDRIQDLRSFSIQGSRELVAEYRIVHKEGRVVHVIDHAIPFQTPEGPVSSLDGIIIDITGRIKLQEQIIRSEGIKTVGEVSARLAHEIRNPLVSAGGFARRLLSSMSPDDPNRSKVEIILKEVGRLESILRTILNYIQPLELDPASHDLNAALRNVLGELQPRIEKRPARLRLQLSTELQPVHFDLKQIRRVIETLVLNALHQMPLNALLHLETSQTPEMVALTMVYPVSHLSTDDTEHFFYPFTTFHGLCEAVDLPLCRLIVNKHQGTLEARMTEPKIVSIHMALPR
jgi:PAS domain S-box-containing protein